MVQIFPTPHPSLAPSLCKFNEGIKGAIVLAAYMLMALYGDEAWSIGITHTRMAPYTPGPCFPDFIQVARSQQGWGWGGGHKVGPDLSWSPGGTTHHALWMGGAQGGLGGPSRSLCTREKAVSTWFPPSPGP